MVMGAIHALHETEGIANVGIYASPGVWNNIVGNYQPTSPTGWPTICARRTGPGSCAGYSDWVNNHGAQLPGPPEIVQYQTAQQLRRGLRLLAGRWTAGPAGTCATRGGHRSRTRTSTPCTPRASTHAVLDTDWRNRVERHSLGWVCAFEAATRLIGFVNVAWDGGAHAFVVDTLVAAAGIDMPASAAGS